MLKLNNGNRLAYSAGSDIRLSDATLLSGAYYMTAKSDTAAAEIAREATAWGARVEQIGRSLIVSAD